MTGTRLTRTIFCLCNLLFSAFVVAQIPVSESLEEIAGRDKQRAARIMGQMDQTGGFSRASTNFDIHHYRCEWNIDPANRYIRGKVTAAFRMTESADHVIFDLTDSLVVDSVVFRQSAIPFSRIGDNSLSVLFPQALDENTIDSLAIHYQGIPPSGPGFGSFANEQHAGTPIIWTLSQPYGSMEWWPCKNGLNDKTDSIDILITTPDRYTSVANGMLQAEQAGNGNRLTWWKHRYPIASYLVAMASTNYTVLNDTIQLANRVLPLIQHAYPENATAFRNGVPLTRRTIRLFHNSFGEYPFLNERYGHTQFSWRGGMEHQTNSFMFNLSEGLVVHEAAHQWFGDKITCGSWSDIWLNEGFAVFLSNYSFERFYSYSQLLFNLKIQLDLITSKPDGSVFVYDTTSVDRIFDYRLTYLKSAWVLQMLRWQLGDSAFFTGVRSYLEDGQVKYGYARTKDLQRNLETAGGQDLDEFFNDWVYGEGYPSYDLTWTPIGNGWIQTRLSQTASHASVSFFEMPVPIRFKNSSRDTVLIFDHRQNNQSAYLKLGFTPDSAFIDPELKLISAGNKVTRKDLEPSATTIIVFPNPAPDKCYLMLKNFATQDIALTLHNNLGQLLWNRNLPAFSGSTLVEIPAENLPGGIYFVRVKGSKGDTFTRKVLK
jgi:aminopeptidase N